MEKLQFSGGLNIALKIPKIHFEKTIKFYRDVLGFDLKEISPPNSPTIFKSYNCKFGTNHCGLTRSTIIQRRMSGLR